MTDQQPEGQEPRGPVPPSGPPPQPTPPPGPQQVPGPQPVHGQPPFGQPPYGQPPRAQPPYGQPPHAQPPYAQPPHAQPPYAQPPHAQPPYGQLPPGTPPYGPYGATYAQRPPAPGMAAWGKVVLGVLIGLFVSVGSPLLAFALAGVDAPVELLVFLVTIIPVLLASPLLIARQTRSWGIGIMLGLAVGSFVLGGACVSIVASY